MLFRSVVVVAVCAVISFAGKIASAFRDKVTTQEIAYYPSDGYTDYVSSSSVTTNTVSSAKGVRFLKSWVKNIRRILPNVSEDDYNKVTNFLEDAIEFESFNLDDLSKTVNFIDYSNETGKLYFFILYVTPSETEDKFKFQAVNFACRLKIGSSFRVVETTAKNCLRTKSTQDLIEVKGSLTVQGLIDAISLGLAPVFTGAAGIPQEVVDLTIKSLKDEAEAYMNDPTRSSFV